MIPEILAPAGSFESLVAAVRCGANAVYLGGKSFNARRNANNFTDSEIKDAVDYCHKRNVKVYITFNTLATDKEIDSAFDEIKFLCETGVDAFIVQDIGLAGIIRQVCSSVSIHASTQMSVQSIDGIKKLKDMGFTRVVLPRELSKEEIKIISDNTDMELEYFVHGALCMCISGQCLMSSMIGGRSGNRGVCAQPCRLPMGMNNKGGYNLSLKDLSLIEKIPELTDCGICSLKIEGRMKRPEYVAAAVTACKNAINNIHDSKISSALEAVFSRSGFTSGYFDGKLGKSMFGIRTKDDVENSGNAIDYLCHLYDNENPLIPVKFTADIHLGKHASLKAEYGSLSYTSFSDSNVVSSVNKELTEDEIKSRLSKCGGTQFYADEINISVDKGIYLSASELNSLRRNALTGIEKLLCNDKSYSVNRLERMNTIHLSKSKKIYARFNSADQLPDDFCGIDKIIVPIDTSENKIALLKQIVNHVSIEIPVNVFSNSEFYLSRLLTLKRAGADSAWVCNLDGAAIAEKAKISYSTGFGMNVFNSFTLNKFEKDGAEECLLSCELSKNDISFLSGTIPRGIVSYGRIPLMVTRNCPIKNQISCSECKKSSKLVDRMGIEFPVRCSNGCSFLFNSRPVCLYDETAFLPVDYELLYFSVETKEECRKIIDCCMKKAPPDYEFTRGFFNKKII